MKKWEYKILECHRTEDDLNMLGSDGWELVAVIPETDDNYIAYFLKREIQSSNNNN